VLTGAASNVASNIFCFCPTLSEHSSNTLYRDGCHTDHQKYPTLKEKKRFLIKKTKKFAAFMAPIQTKKPPPCGDGLGTIARASWAISCG
jgi:hypothetical protein